MRMSFAGTLMLLAMAIPSAQGPPTLVHSIELPHVDGRIDHLGVAADSHVVAIANGEGDGVQFIDADDFRSIRSIRLGDDADNVRYDTAARLLYVGYGSGALAAARPRDGIVTGTVKLPAAS